MENIDQELKRELIFLDYSRGIINYEQAAAALRAWAERAAAGL